MALLPAAVFGVLLVALRPRRATMAIPLIPAARPAALRPGPLVRPAYGGALHRRADRLNWLFVVMVLLLPQLITVLLGGN